MTVDMLATAFIWPEEMLIGPNRIKTDAETPPEGDETSAVQDPETETMPFWAALMRRFRAQPAAPGTEAH